MIRLWPLPFFLLSERDLLVEQAKGGHKVLGRMQRVLLDPAASRQVLAAEWGLSNTKPLDKFEHDHVLIQICERGLRRFCQLVEGNPGIGPSPKSGRR